MIKVEKKLRMKLLEIILNYLNDLYEGFSSLIFRDRFVMIKAKVKVEYSIEAFACLIGCQLFDGFYNSHIRWTVFLNLNKFYDLKRRLVNWFALSILKYGWFRVIGWISHCHRAFIVIPVWLIFRILYLFIHSLSA